MTEDRPAASVDFTSAFCGKRFEDMAGILTLQEVKRACWKDAQRLKNLHGPDVFCAWARQIEAFAGGTEVLQNTVPFPVSWTVKMKKKQKETQDILSYHTQAAGCSDKARAKASGGRQPIEECGRTGL